MRAFNRCLCDFPLTYPWDNHLIHSLGNAPLLGPVYMRSAIPLAEFSARTTLILASRSARLFLRKKQGTSRAWFTSYTAILRNVVGKSAHDNLKRYCGGFWVHCFSKKFERMAWETMDICLRVLKGSNESRLDSFCQCQQQCIDPMFTFRDCHVHIFSDNLSRNSRKHEVIWEAVKFNSEAIK